MLYAVEKNDGRQLVVLGGASSTDVNFHIGQDGMFLLLIAAAKGHDEMINLLLQNRRLDINKRDKFGVNAFWIAAFYGHVKTLELLAKTEIDKYAMNQNGSNALHMAVKRNNREVLNALIKMDYDLNRPKNNGVTALGIAALAGNDDFFTNLMDNGADPAYTNERGIGALYLAIKGKSKTLTQLLVNLGVPVHFVDDPQKVDNSAVFYAIRMNNQGALEAISDRIGIEQLNFMTNSQGHNPLTYAASLKNFELVNYLTGRGMHIDVEDREGKTVLLRALESYNQGLAEKLLARGADIDLVNREGKTALSILVQRHYLEQVNFLIERGANCHIEDLSGRDACDYAELGDVHVFPQLNNCRKYNMHLRIKCDVD